MQVIRTLDGNVVEGLSRGSIVTIGNFDGLHLGHQALLQRVLERSKALQLPAVVVCFEPTPQEFFSPQNPPARLMRFAEKHDVLEDRGVDIFCCLDFDARMRAGSPEWFATELLVGALNVKHIVVGEHFHYGKNRAGDIEDLKRAGGTAGFEVRGVTDVEIDGTAVSSTLIRRALSSGNLGYAEKLLGRHYRMSGEVVHGNHLGRKLGFPTANIEPDRLQVALAGIFAVRVLGLEGSPLDGVASLGTRPAVGGTEMILEVHIFDFDEDIYGRDLKIDFVEKIRDESNFPDLDALIEQMNKDVVDARRILSS